MTKFRRIRSPGASFHVRKLISQGGDTACVQLGSYGREEGVLHACARAMRQHKTGLSTRWQLQQGGNAARVIDGYRYGLCR